MPHESIDKRQKRSKKQKGNQLFKRLCNPRLLRLLLQLGPMIFWLTKPLIELVKFFRG